MPSKLEIVLSVLSEGMEGFTKAGDNLDNLKKKSEGLSKATGSLTGAVVGFIAPLATAATAMAALHSAMDLGDTIRKQSDALSMSTTAVQEWNYAAKQSGGSAEAVTTSFEKLTKNVYAAATGNKELAQTFKAYNISLTDTHGNLRDVESITNDTMRAIASIKDPIERAGAANDLLGKSSKDLLPLLASGTEAMDAQRKAAGDLGQVLSESSVRALDDAGDALDTFNTSMKVASAEVVAELVPTLMTFTDTAKGVVHWLGEMARGWEWVTGGETDFDTKMKLSEGETKFIQNMVEMKKATQNAIDTQNVFKAKGSALFDQGTLDAQVAKLERINKILHDTTAKKEDKDPETNEGLRKAQLEAAEKAKKDAHEKELKAERARKDALKKLNDAYNDDMKKQDDELKQAYENSTRIKKEAEEREKKEAADKLARNKKLDADLDRAQLANAKDETTRRQVALRQEQRDIERAYREQIKDANGAADEIAKANELKNLNIKNSNEAYNEWYKEAEKAKRDVAKNAAMDTLSNATNMFQQLAEKNKSWANVYKASAISQTLISTYQGAQDAFTSLAKIPYVGVALGLVAAATAVTSGLIRVNEIRKQNFASGTDGALQYGTYADVGEMGRERVYLPAGSQVENHHKTTQQINNSRQKTTNLNVYVQNTDGSYDKKFVRGLRNGSMDYATRLMKKKMGVA